MATRQYIGARYVPVIMGPWDAQQEYEPLSVVLYNNSSYTSKRQVPAGIAPTDTTFWALTGNYNAQIDEFAQAFQEYKDTAVRRFNSLVDMVGDMSVHLGDVIQTLGYYEANDGGAALYLVRLALDTDIYSAQTDGSTSETGLVRLAANYDGGVLVAELIMDTIMSPEQFGALGDGSADDSTAVLNALKNANIHGNGTYKITENIIITGTGKTCFLKNVTGSGSVVYEKAFFCEYAGVQFVTTANDAFIFHSETNDSPVTHNKLSVDNIQAAVNGILFSADNDGYVNENTINKTNIAADTAICFINNSSNAMNGNRFYDIDPEASNLGFLFSGTGVSMENVFHIREIEYANRVMIRFDATATNNIFYIARARGVMFDSTNNFICAPASANLVYGKLMTLTGAILWTDSIVFANNGLAIAAMHTRKPARLNVTRDIVFNVSADTANNFCGTTELYAYDSVQHTITLDNGFAAHGNADLKIIVPRGNWAPTVKDSSGSTIYSEPAVADEAHEIDLRFTPGGVVTSNLVQGMKFAAYEIPGGSSIDILNTPTTSLACMVFVGSANTSAVYHSFGGGNFTLIGGAVDPAYFDMTGRTFTAVGASAVRLGVMTFAP